MKAAGHVGQGRVHDGDVEHQHGGGRAHSCERQAAGEHVSPFQVADTDPRQSPLPRLTRTEARADPDNQAGTKRRPSHLADTFLHGWPTWRAPSRDLDVARPPRPPETVRQLTGLLPTDGSQRAELARLAADGGLLVLGDIALPLSIPPVAAVAFEFDRAARTAHLVSVGVVTRQRRHGLGRRLFEGATMLLRAEGIERVEARPGLTTAPSPFLAAIGFEWVPGPGPGLRLVYWL